MEWEGWERDREGRVGDEKEDMRREGKGRKGREEGKGREWKWREGR